MRTPDRDPGDEPVDPDGWSPLKGLLGAVLVHLTAEARRRELTDGEQRWRRAAWLAVAILDAGHDLPASLSDDLADLPEERHPAPSQRR